MRHSMRARQNIYSFFLQMRLSLSSISSEREAHRAGRRPGRAALTSKRSQRVRRDQRQPSARCSGSRKEGARRAATWGEPWFPRIVDKGHRGAERTAPGPDRTARSAACGGPKEARARTAPGKGEGVRGARSHPVSASCARLTGVLGRRVSGLFPRERFIPASRFYGSFLSMALYHDALPARGYIAFACFLFIVFHRGGCRREQPRVRGARRLRAPVMC